MNANIKSPSEVKAAFREKGETFRKWAADNGYDPTHVSRVLNGSIKASYGKSHEIAVKLGLKAAA